MAERQELVRQTAGYIAGGIGDRRSAVCEALEML
jgi:hypothetical protein